MFVKPPKIIRLFYPNLTWKKQTNSKKIWLTFDDGPDPDVTPWLLSCLKNERVKATFFLIGRDMEKFPEIVKLIENEGHVIGNHSYSHKNGWITNNNDYLEDVMRCQKLMPENKLYRPPYGKLSFNQINTLKKQYKLILWDVLSMDFNTPSISKIKKNVLNNVENGSIIVFHNNKKSFNVLKESLKNIIRELQKKGFQFSNLW